MGLQDLRTDLACALRWAARLGMNEGVDNHFSVAVPDGDGNVLEGDNAVETTAFCIHAPVHRMVANAVVVLHTHMPYATSLTLLEGGRLEMCEQNALMFDGRIAYDDDYEGLALDVAEGERMARKIGNGSVLFLASHGVIVTGPTVADAFNDLYYLERAATFQVLARSTGGRLRRIPQRVRETCLQQFADDRPGLARRHFAALRRMLDAKEPEYRM